MEILIILLIFSLPVGFLASSYGRSGFAWYVLSVLISPLIAGILLLILGKVKDTEHRPCPRCAEPIRWEAKVCRFCGAALAEDDPATAAGRTAGERWKALRTAPPSA